MCYKDLDANIFHSYVPLKIGDLQFTLYERAIVPLAVNNYRWQLNKNNNFHAYEGDNHVFTWQPHGSQFTIIEDVPMSATKLRIKKYPGILAMTHVFRLLRFKPDWIEMC